jgi:hypothetical protein
VLAIADAKDDMKLVGELPLVEEVMARALALDPDYDRGAIHEFYVAYDAARGEAQGGGAAKAMQSYRDFLNLQNTDARLRAEALRRDGTRESLMAAAAEANAPQSPP